MLYMVKIIPFYHSRSYTNNFGIVYRAIPYKSHLLTDVVLSFYFHNQ